MNELFGYLIPPQNHSMRRMSKFKRFNRNQGHTSVNELINHIAKQEWQFWFMPQSKRLPISYHSWKGREFFNNTSVFQAASRISTTNAKVAGSQAYLGTDERFHLFTFSVIPVSTQDLGAHYRKLLKCSYWCEEISENIQFTHSKRNSTWKSCKDKAEVEHYILPATFIKTKESSKTEKLSWKGQKHYGKFDFTSLSTFIKNKECSKTETFLQLTETL